MTPSKLIVWFAIASIAGWLYESIYSVITTGHWEKRGFLFGPLCPIYGVGVCGALLVFDHPEMSIDTIPVWVVFLICMVGSAIIEYVVSFVLEELFGTVWWDYSDMPFNVNGRICLPASLLFGLAGLGVVYLAIPLVHIVDTLIPPLVFELASLVIVALISVDFTTTVLSLSDLMDKITSLDVLINQRADEGIQLVGDVARAIPQRAEEQVLKTQDRIQGRMRTAADDIANNLTKRQTQLLLQLKRFSSSRLGDFVALLINIVHYNDEQDDE